MAQAAVQLTFYSPFVLQTIVFTPTSVKGEHELEMRRCHMPRDAFLVCGWTKSTGAPYFYGSHGMLTDPTLLDINETNFNMNSTEALSYCPRALLVFDEVGTTSS